jgi:hypothetical protein
MASYRRRRREPSEETIEPPTTPLAEPPPVPASSAAEQDHPDSVQEAERQAIRQRLAEIDAAERAAQAPQQPQTPSLPERVQLWLAAHPELITNRRNNLRLQLAHEEAVEAGVGLDSPSYISELEKRLGLHDPRAESPAAARPLHPPAASFPAPAPGPPVSAPVSREPASWSSGRPVTSNAPLTTAETEVARSLGLDPREYARQRDKMNALKRAGAIQS